MSYFELKKLEGKTNVTRDRPPSHVCVLQDSLAFYLIETSLDLFVAGVD